MKRCISVAVVALVLGTTPLVGQGLRDQIGQLFIFGSGEEALFLAGTADPSNPTNVQVHGDHFIPSAVESNGTLISFLTTAISASVANLPISSTSGGRTFRFEGGVPVATTTSPGPILAERANTLGRGRVLVGATVNVFNFKTVRGVGLDDLTLTFTHENTDFPNCDVIFSGDCSLYGIPSFENDLIQLDLSLDLRVVSALFAVTYGLLDWVDISVALPVVTTSLRGTSTAQVIPFGGPDVNHFFEGSLANPGLSSTRFVDGSATGLGDVAARIKIALGQSERAAFAILGDARFATGSEEDLLGSGNTSIRGLGILSARFDAFSPHVNVGYAYRTGELENDAVLATVGFDHLLAPWVALAVDIVSELQVGANELIVPQPVSIEEPFDRSIAPSNIPSRRDDIVNASLGFKFATPSGLTIVTNTLWPLNRGGLRPTAAWTAGLEFNF
jgi:hypothetical protein